MKKRLLLGAALIFISLISHAEDLSSFEMQFAKNSGFDSVKVVGIHQRWASLNPFGLLSTETQLRLMDLIVYRTGQRIDLQCSAVINGDFGQLLQGEIENLEIIVSDCKQLSSETKAWDKDDSNKIYFRFGRYVHNHYVR